MRPGVERELAPLRYGGTGTQSDEDRQPDSLPDRYEPGNHNVPGLAGLDAALDFINSQTVAEIESHHHSLAARLLAGLSQIEGVRVYGPPTAECRTSVVSFNLEGYDPQELAALLDASHGVQCRAGLHCAPRMHASLGTTGLGGAVRLSPGHATTLDEIDATVAALEQAAHVPVR
jgi:selenocysteine lyase/cysteine desulfurase